MYAFERSMKLGSDMLEVDVNTTKDGKLAIIHDGAVDRTTNGTGPVADYTMAAAREARRRAVVRAARGRHAGRARGPVRLPGRPYRTEEASAGLRPRRLPAARALRADGSLPRRADQHRDQGRGCRGRCVVPPRRRGAGRLPQPLRPHGGDRGRLLQRRRARSLPRARPGDRSRARDRRRRRLRARRRAAAARLQGLPGSALLLRGSPSSPRTSSTVLTATATPSTSGRSTTRRR